MKLTVDREDLRQESQNKNCSQIGYDDLNEQAKRAVEQVGAATFREYDGSNYNAIYPPKASPAAATN